VSYKTQYWCLSCARRFDIPDTPDLPPSPACYRCGGTNTEKYRVVKHGPLEGESWEWRCPFCRREQKTRTNMDVACRECEHHFAEIPAAAVTRYRDKGEITHGRRALAGLPQVQETRRNVSTADFLARTKRLPVKRCPSCRTEMNNAVGICPGCGFVMAKP
jgi:hypothetical protein